MINQTCFICLIFVYAIGIISVEAQEQATKLQPVGEEAYQVMLQFFQYDKDIPLNVRIVEKTEMEKCVREKIIFTGIRNSRVPGYFAFPKNGKPPYPCVLLLHGYTASKSSFWEDVQDAVDYEWKYAQISNGILSEGYAVLALDMPYHGERAFVRDYEPPNNILRNNWIIKALDMIAWSTIDYRKAIDYLTTRADIDSTRIGVLGMSGGGWITFMLTAVEPRVKVSVSTVTPISIYQNRYGIVTTNFAPRIMSPFLMIMGREDEWYTVDSAEHLYDLINSPIKNIIWYNSGHNLPIEHVEDVINWFNEHL